MKYLSNYIQDAQTTLLNQTGAFFAFSQEQFNEGKKEGAKYSAIGGGMICPKEKVDILMAGLDVIQQAGIKQDIADNGIEAIIARELSNHEAFYTYNLSDTIQALEDYDIKPEQVKEVFNKLKILAEYQQF